MPFKLCSGYKKEQHALCKAWNVCFLQKWTMFEARIITCFQTIYAETQTLLLWQPWGGKTELVLRTKNKAKKMRIKRGWMKKSMCFQTLHHPSANTSVRLHYTYVKTVCKYWGNLINCDGLICWIPYWGWGAPVLKLI